MNSKNDLLVIKFSLARLIVCMRSCIVTVGIRLSKLFLLAIDVLGLLRRAAWLVIVGVGVVLVSLIGFLLSYYVGVMISGP